MIDQVWKWLSCNRDAQIFHMGKIRLCSFSRCMNLFKDDIFFWSVERSPPGNMPPQRAILCGAIPIRMPFAEQSKQRGRLQSRIAFELLDHPRPVFFKWIGAGLPLMGSLEAQRAMLQPVRICGRYARSCQHVPLLVFVSFLFVVQTYTI